jgi:hypothetical protein
MAIFIIILLIIFVIAATIAFKDGEGEGIGTLFSILAITFAIILYLGIDARDEVIESYQKEIKLELPEEIYLAKQGDTLYIDKRTKDSIYLGFRKFKTE